MKTHLFKLILVIFLGFASLLQAFAQTEVTGTVTDEIGALPGVNILVKGSSNGAITGEDGKYTISANEGDVLVFSFIGYANQEITVGKSSVIDVFMKEDAQQLEALVVVGYGVQKRKDVTGAIASVDMEKMNYTPGGDAANMLKGQIAGVEITASSGRPGAASNIQIRGSRSLNGGNSPLFVIDGSPATSEEFETINSADIASIEVLKDAASQTIYGTRAANGVILITTKRGKTDKVSVNLSSYGAVQTLWRNFDFYDGEGFYNLRREAIAGDNMFYDSEEYSILNPSYVLNDKVMEEVYEKKEFTDWEKLMFKPAWSHKHDLSVSGGSDKVRVAAGLGYYDQYGMLKTGSRYQRITSRLNMDFKIFNWLSMGVNASYARSKQIREYGNFKSFITRTPIANPYDADGAYAPYINSANDPNPLYEAQQFSRRTDRDNYRLNIFFDVKPFKGFNYRLNMAYYNRFSEDGKYTTSKAIGSTGEGTLDNGKYENILIENIFTYAVPIRNMNHRLNLTLMQSYDYTMGRAIGYSANNVPVDMDWNMLHNGTISDTRRVINEETMLSFMARVQYSLMDRYLFTLSLRHDGNSKFGPNNKWATFPSVSAGWLLSEEPWMKSARAVNNLKIRASWGQVGSHDGLSRYKSLGLADAREMEYGDQFLMGYLPGEELSNPNIGWETTSQFNFGVDFGFWEDRLHGSVEFFSTDTKDLLVKRTIPSSLGYKFITDNMGRTSTWGTEISLSGDIIRKNGIIWSMGTNFSLYRNKILKINDQLNADGRPADDLANEWFIGHPLHVYYDYKFDGIYQFEDFDLVGDEYILKNTVDTDGDGTPDQPLLRDDKIVPGSVKVSDVNGDGKIDASDKIIIPRDPKFTLSFNTSLKIKGFDLFADFYAVVGRKIRNPYLYEYNSGGSLQGKLNGIAVNYWTPQNPSNEFPRPRYSQSIPYLSSLSYQDASYFRLRTLTLGYTLPQAIMQKAKIQKLRFYLTATNLFTCTKFKSYSPEIIPGSYPEARQWVFGLNFNF